MTETKRQQRSSEATSAAERVAAEYRARFHRLLVAGILIAAVMVTLGIVVVYALDQTPGMAPGTATPGLLLPVS